MDPTITLRMEFVVVSLESWLEIGVKHVAFLELWLGMPSLELWLGLASFAGESV